MQLTNMGMQNTKRGLLQTVASFPEMAQCDGSRNWLEMGLKGGCALPTIPRGCVVLCSTFEARMQVSSQPRHGKCVIPRGVVHWPGTTFILTCGLALGTGEWRGPGEWRPRESGGAGAGEWR